MFVFVCSGYDFGYLLRMLTNKAMPVDEANFFELLPEYFPVIYDIKVSPDNVICKLFRAATVLLLNFEGFLQEQSLSLSYFWILLHYYKLYRYITENRISNTSVITIHGKSQKSSQKEHLFLDND